MKKYFFTLLAFVTVAFSGTLGLEDVLAQTPDNNLLTRLERVKEAEKELSLAVKEKEVIQSHVGTYRKIVEDVQNLLKQVREKKKTMKPDVPGAKEALEFADGEVNALVAALEARETEATQKSNDAAELLKTAQEELDKKTAEAKEKEEDGDTLRNIELFYTPPIIEASEAVRKHEAQIREAAEKAAFAKSLADKLKALDVAGKLTGLAPAAGAAPPASAGAALTSDADTLSKAQEALDEIITQLASMSKEAIDKAEAKAEAAKNVLTDAEDNNVKALDSLETLENVRKFAEDSSYCSLQHLRAAPDSGETNLTLNPEDDSSNNVLNRIIRLLATVIGTFAVLMLIIAAFFLITSEGDQNRLQNGKNIFFYTIVGLVVAFVSYILVQFVLSILFT